MKYRINCNYKIVKFLVKMFMLKPSFDHYNITIDLRYKLDSCRYMNYFCNTTTFASNGHLSEKISSLYEQGVSSHLALNDILSYIVATCHTLIGSRGGDLC